MSINFYRIMKGILWYLVKPKDEEMYRGNVSATWGIAEGKKIKT